MKNGISPQVLEDCIQQDLFRILAVLPVHHAAKVVRLDEISFLLQRRWVIVGDEGPRIGIPKVRRFGDVVPPTLEAALVEIVADQPGVGILLRVAFV